MSQGVKQTAVDKRLYEAYKATKPTNLTPAPTYCNAATKGLYKGNGMGTPRADANDNLLHASRNSGAQIVRCV